MNKRVTLKAVNKALAAAGIKDELVKGKRYFYFWGDKIQTWCKFSVFVPRLSDMAVEQWVAQYRILEHYNAAYGRPPRFY